jgi:hypothetical protein
MELTKSRIFLIAFIAAIIVSYSFFQKQRATYASITTFDGCVAAGFPRLESYPEQCKMPGKTFTNPRQKVASIAPPIETTDTPLHDFRNEAYVIDGTKIDFVNGHAEYLTTTMKSPPATTTSDIVGEPFIFRDSSSVSSTTALIIKSLRAGAKKEFYHLTASIKLRDTSTGINAVYLGEDVNTPSFVYKNGRIVLRYETPKKRIERQFVIEKNLLTEVSQANDY